MEKLQDIQKLQDIYSDLETSKTIDELLVDLEGINIREENGRNVDVILHYTDGSIRWIAFKKVTICPVCKKGTLEKVKDTSSRICTRCTSTFNRTYVNDLEKLSNSPATKSQLDALIMLCLDGGHTEAAGLFQLGSDILSNEVRKNDNPVFCTCYEYAGDNPACKIHGTTDDNHGEFSDSDIQEHAGIYQIGMGA